MKSKKVLDIYNFILNYRILVLVNSKVEYKKL